MSKKTISIFKSLTSASATVFTYGDNSGGARLFEGYFIKHQLDANDTAMSRYHASGSIVGIAIHGESTVAADTLQVSVRQGSAASPTNTLYSMSAGAAMGAFDQLSSGGCGLILRASNNSAGQEDKGYHPLPPRGITFQVNTDNQDSNHEDLYVFLKASNARVGDCTVRVDIELDSGRGSLRLHKKARFKGTSAGALL